MKMRTRVKRKTKSEPEWGGTFVNGYKVDHFPVNPGR
jgi:hypothetical protein